MKNFDYNATTPMRAVAVQAWYDASQQSWENASSSYSAGVRVKVRLNRARENMGKLLGVVPASLVFCSGATEACNIWVQSFFHYFNAPNDRLLVSDQEHACLRESIQIYGGDRVQWFTPTESDVTAQLQQTLEGNSDIKGVVMMAANNETGICNPWKAVSELCRERGLPFFCDTCQLFGKLPVEDLGKLDFFCLSAHKFGGPKGTGLLKISSKYPFVRGAIGGGQEQGLRAGTEDYPSIIAMYEALKESSALANNAESVDIRLSWKNEFCHRIVKTIPGSVIHNEGRESLWNTVSIGFPQKDASYWVEALDQAGFMVSAGSACSSSTPKESSVLRSLGVERRFALRTLRISASWDIDESDWLALHDALSMIWRRVNSEPKSVFTEVIDLDSF